jgi:hypothetical protein
VRGAGAEEAGEGAAAFTSTRLAEIVRSTFIIVVSIRIKEIKKTISLLG